MASSDQFYDAIVFSEELTQSQREMFIEVLQGDPALTEIFKRWHLLQRAIGESMECHIPDRSLLVLFALDAEGQDEFISDAERLELERARPVLERAFQAHPAFGEIVRQIRRDVSVFEEIWDTHFDDEHSGPRSGHVDRNPISRSTRRTSTVRWVWRIAAVIAVVAFSSILLLMLQRDSSLMTVRTGEEEVRLVEFADGSTARLLDNSELTYVDPDRKVAFDRRIRLRGRAFFDISPGQEGFIVATPSARITVLGTSFGVQAEPDVTEVILATGRLAVAPEDVPDRVVVLEEGQMSRVTSGALPTTPTDVDLTEALSWTGLFVFRATPIEKIAELLSRHYGVTIEVADSLGGERITGIFSPDLSVTDILNTITATLGAVLEETGEENFLLKQAV